MHECPWCGQVCDCDGEDTWLNAPEDCAHECDDYEDEDEWPEELANTDLFGLVEGP